MRDCPTIVARGRKTSKSLSEGTFSIPPNHGRFYAVKDNKEENPDEGASK